MQHDSSEFSHRHGLALLLALTALVAGPLAVASPATAAPSLVSVQSAIAPTVADTAAQSPADATLRTTTTLAGVAIGAVVLVGLWWYLVARRRD